MIDLIKSALYTVRMSIQVGIGLSSSEDPLQAVTEAIKQARSNMPAKADVAIIFSSVEFAHPQILSAAGKLLADAAILGCSSLAVISGDGILKRGFLVMLLGLPNDVYCNTTSVREISAKTTQKAGEEFGQKLTFGFKGNRRDLGVMFCDGLLADGSGIIHGFQERMGRAFPLVGGSASDNLKFQKTYVYFKQDVITDGLCGMLWGGKVNFSLGIKHGWQPLGKPRRISKSTGNTVAEIDGTPAIGIYEEYFGKSAQELKKDLKHISIFYPIGIYIPGEDEYLLRNILSIEDNGSVVFQGEVPQDSLVRLMIGTKESCLQATRQAAEEAKKTQKALSFALIFNSVSRYTLLGRDAGTEIEIVKEVLGPHVPLAGFYTYGEQAPLKALNYLGAPYFHNQTITILGIAG